MVILPVPPECTKVLGVPTNKILDRITATDAQPLLERYGCSSLSQRQVIWIATALIYGYASGQNDEEIVAQLQEGNERYRDLSLVGLKVQAGLYLLDREAIEILWLDEHGQIAWEHRLNPYTSTLGQVTGCLLNATSLVELAGYNGTYGAQFQTQRD